MSGYFVSKKKQAGFSLIELLVVIAIIGILIALIYVNFQEARKNTRDKVRQTTLVDLQLSIESYKAQTGQYPSAGCGATGWVTADPATVNSMAGSSVCAGGFISGLVPSYIGSLPDPTRKEGVGFYYKTDGNSYKLLLLNSVEGTANQVSSYAHKLAACPAQCTVGLGLCSNPPDADSYAVYSPGGECF